MSDSDELTPGPAAGRPTELQQLEAALAAGVITPELFATLKAKLQPTAPPAPAPKSTPPPAEVELPSLLDMFSRPPASVEALSPPPAPAPRTPPVASPPPRPTAAEEAARQRIEEHLIKMRQAPPPAPSPAPPSFYPEPKPAPTFYPEPQPAAPSVPPPAPPVRPSRPSQPVTEGRTSASWVVILLLIAVIGAVAYFLTNSSHPDEDLTSTAPATTQLPPPVATPAPASKKSKKRTRLPKHKAKAARAALPVASSSPDSVEEVAAPASRPTAAAPTTAPSASAAGRPIPAAGEPGDDAAATQVRAAMASYYADLNAPPLHASEHFAPQVERLYIRQNLTPDAIDAELARSFFPDNQQAQARIEPGTLRVSEPAADGSRTATFTEQMRLYRPSLQKYQRLRTQVRVRFNAAYQIVYMRQEKLLGNTFEE